MFTKKKTPVKKSAEELAKETAQLAEWFEKKKEEEEGKGNEKVKTTSTSTSTSSVTRRQLNAESASLLDQYASMTLIDGDLAGRAEALVEAAKQIEEATDEDLLSSTSSSSTTSSLSPSLLEKVSDDQYLSVAREEEERKRSVASRTLGIDGTSVADLDIASDLWAASDPSDTLFSSQPLRPTRKVVSKPSLDLDLDGDDDGVVPQQSTSVTTSSKFDDLFGDDSNVFPSSSSSSGVSDKDGVSVGSTVAGSKKKRDDQEGPTIITTKLLDGSDPLASDYFGDQSSISQDVQKVIDLSDISAYLQSNSSFLDRKPSLSFD